METRKGMVLLKKDGLCPGDLIVIVAKKTFFPENHQGFNTIVAEYRGHSDTGVRFREERYGCCFVISFAEIHRFYKPTIFDLIAMIKDRERAFIEIKKQNDRIIKEVIK